MFDELKAYIMDKIANHESMNAVLKSQGQDNLAQFGEGAVSALEDVLYHIE
jgi:hypothetical protein